MLINIRIVRLKRRHFAYRLLACRGGGGGLEDLAAGFSGFFSFFSSESTDVFGRLLVVALMAGAFDFRPLLARAVSLVFVIGMAMALGTVTVGGLRLISLGCSGSSANRTRFLARQPEDSDSDSDSDSFASGLLSSCSESVLILGRFCLLRKLALILGTAVALVLGSSGMVLGDLEAPLVGDLMDDLEL